MNEELQASNKPLIGVSLKEFALKYGIYIGFIGIMIAFSFMSPNFLTARNVLNVLDQYAYYVICSMGMFFVVLMGGVDLSNGSMIAFASVVGATIMVQSKSVLLGCIIIVAISVAGGVLNGYSVAGIGIPAFIATLAFQNILRGAAYTKTMAKAVSGIPSSLSSFNFTKIFGIRSSTAIMIAIFIILFYILNFTGFGRRLYAVGGNARAAKVMGVKVPVMVVSAYAICGICTSISSILLVSSMASANPSVAENLALECIAAVIIGGASANGGEGKLSGTIIGAFMFAMIKNGLNLMGLSYFHQLVVSGVIIYIAVAVDRMRVRSGL
ncbi:MAG: ABC transporter permease [Eubacterium sp.]|jgi:ribose transport system permease protein|nr:ABC transporter permease [Eubacterium sp.]